MSRTKLRALLSLGFWQPPGDPVGLSREELERIISVHGGTLRFDLGMLPLVELQSVEDAALCALAIVDRVPPHDAGLGGMGIHLGDTMDPEGGPSTEVRAAAMMAQRTRPGAIGISRLASMQVAGKMQVVLTEAGEVVVPGMNRPLRVVTMAVPPVEVALAEEPAAPVAEEPAAPVAEVPPPLPVQASTVGTPPPLEVPVPTGTPPAEVPPPLEVPPPIETPPAEIPPPLEVPPMEVPPPVEVPPPLEPPPAPPQPPVPDAPAPDVPPPLPPAEEPPAPVAPPEQPPELPPAEAPPAPPPLEPPASVPSTADALVDLAPPHLAADAAQPADLAPPALPMAEAPPPLPSPVEAAPVEVVAAPDIVETLPPQPPPIPHAPAPEPPAAVLPDAVIVESVPVVTSAEAPIAPAPPVEEPPAEAPQEAPPPAEPPSPVPPAPVEEPPPPPEVPPPAPPEEPPVAAPEDEDRTTMALAPPPPPPPPVDDEDGTLIGVRTSFGVRGVTAEAADAALLDQAIAAADAAMAQRKPYAALYELDGALADARARGTAEAQLGRVVAKREAISAILGFAGDAHMIEEGADGPPRAVHLLVGGTKRVGRAGTSVVADISIGFRLVSRADRQTRITAMRDGYVVEDLGGTNAACLGGLLLDAGRKVVVEDAGPVRLTLGGVRDPLEEGDCRFELVRRNGHLVLTLSFAHLDEAGLGRLAEHWENWRKDAGATWIMVGGPVVLGTGEAADLRLDEGEGRIAQIDHLGGSYTLTPLEGAVLVDDVPILAPVRLSDGCRIALGGEVFSFRSTGA